jgi:hypothetical protein
MKVLIGFGLNEDGQSGASVKKEKEIGLPQIIKFPTRVQIVAISAGSRHSLALSDDGAVYSWGWGLSGQLGHGDNISLSHPLRVPSLQNISAISAGGMHSGCISAEGVCYMWGDNSQGQLGVGLKDRTTIFQPTPICLEDRSPFRVSKLSCGGMHSAAVTVDGFLYAFGKSDSGQTGFPTWYLAFSTNIYFPRLVEGISDVIDVKCGGFFTLILTAAGTVYGMGKDDYGCLGTGIEADPHENVKEGPLPVHFPQDVIIKEISAGGWHSLFLSEEGRLYCCGKGEYGRLGLGQEASKLSPTPIERDADSKIVKGVSQVSAGGSHTLWSTKDNHVFSVGRLDAGRCGNGGISTGRAALAVDITKFFPFKDFLVLDVAAGGSHSLILTETAQPLDDTSLIHASSPYISRIPH